MTDFGRFLLYLTGIVFGGYAVLVATVAATLVLIDVIR